MALPGSLLGHLMIDEPYQREPYYGAYSTIARTNQLMDAVRQRRGGGTGVIPSDVPEPVIPSEQEQADNLRRALGKQDIGDPRAVNPITSRSMRMFIQQLVDQAKAERKRKTLGVERPKMPHPLGQPGGLMQPLNPYTDALNKLQSRVQEFQQARGQLARDLKLQEYDPTEARAAAIREQQNTLRRQEHQLNLELQELQGLEYQKKGATVDEFLRRGA